MGACCSTSPNTIGYQFQSGQLYSYHPSRDKYIIYDGESQYQPSNPNQQQKRNKSIDTRKKHSINHVCYCGNLLTEKNALDYSKYYVCLSCCKVIVSETQKKSFICMMNDCHYNTLAFQAPNIVCPNCYNGQHDSNTPKTNKRSIICTKFLHTLDIIS